MDIYVQLDLCHIYLLIDVHNMYVRKMSQYDVLIILFTVGHRTNMMNCLIFLFTLYTKGFHQRVFSHKYAVFPKDILEFSMKF